MDASDPRVVIEVLSPSTMRFEESIGLNAVISLPEIDAVLPLSELYADVTFEP